MILCALRGEHINILGRFAVTLNKSRFFAKFTLSRARSFAALRMTGEGPQNDKRRSGMTALRLAPLP